MNNLHRIKKPKRLEKVPHDMWEAKRLESSLREVWWSRSYLVQIHDEDNGVIRLTVNRMKRNRHGWLDGITWDELQQIKADVGYGNRFAVEIYPADKNLVNEANMRHLWILAEPLAIGWKNE